MRKTTINLIVGILIGMLITGISDSVSTDTKTPTNVPVAATISSQSASTELPAEFTSEIAPGLQIVEVPPPLDLNGRHPYQCYLNGAPVNIPKDVIKGILAEHTDDSEKDPNFNVHNFTGNLKFVGGHTNGVVGE